MSEKAAAKRPASKILEGLKEALAFARCDHDWGRPTRKGNTWTKRCKRCKARVMKSARREYVVTEVL